MGRKELFRALVGSWNYNLNIEADPILGIKESDRDYKVFLLPTFDDLYKGNMYSHDTISDVADYSYQDIRKLGQLFWKANINWIEILYSKEIVFNPEITIEEADLINKIFDMRDEIVVMNLSYLYDACIGMHIEKVKKLHHYSDSCKYMEELYGYNVKEALHAYRVLLTIKKFADQGFKDFEKALRFVDEDQVNMLRIRNGGWSEEAIIKALTGLKNLIETEYKELFHSQSKNEETKYIIDAIIYALVKLNIAK